MCMPFSAGYIQKYTRISINPLKIHLLYLIVLVCTKRHTCIILLVGWESYYSIVASLSGLRYTVFPAIFHFEWRNLMWARRSKYEHDSFKMKNFLKNLLSKVTVYICPLPALITFSHPWYKRVNERSVHLYQSHVGFKQSLVVCKVLLVIIFLMLVITKLLVSNFQVFDMGGGFDKTNANQPYETWVLSFKL